MAKWKTLETLTRKEGKVVDDSLKSYIEGQNEMIQITMDVLHSIDPALAEQVVDALTCLAGPIEEDLDGIKHEMYLHEMFDEALYRVKNK